MSKRKGKDILNRAELNIWMDACMKQNRSFYSIKGSVEDVYYDDDTNDPVKGPVNVAWVCKETGEIFDLKWGYPKKTLLQKLCHLFTPVPL